MLSSVGFGSGLSCYTMTKEESYLFKKPQKFQRLGLGLILGDIAKVAPSTEMLFNSLLQSFSTMVPERFQIAVNSIKNILSYFHFFGSLQQKNCDVIFL